MLHEMASYIEEKSMARYLVFMLLIVVIAIPLYAGDVDVVDVQVLSFVMRTILSIYPARITASKKFIIYP